MVDHLATFARTWRLTVAVRLRSQAFVIIALIALFAIWFLWLVLGKVDIYALSQQARFQPEKFAQPVEAAVAGVVTSCNLNLSQHVHEGEVLVQLDAKAFELQRNESQATLDASLADISSLEGQIDAARDARNAVKDLVNQSAQAGRARVSVSRTTARYKEQETAVLDKLSEQELASKLDKIRAEGDRATNHAQIAAIAAGAAEETSGHKANLLDRDVQIGAMEKSLIDAQSRTKEIRANIASLDYQIEQRLVRAKESGTLADIVPCTPGMLVDKERLATLVPDSEIRVVSLFKPEDTVGRVLPGQHATLRVDNFPWAQFGTVGATVLNVGSEPRDGLIRVELMVTQPNPSIPTINGLTALAEIQVERISPFHLLMRAAGEELGRHNNGPEPSARSGAQ